MKAFCWNDKIGSSIAKLSKLYARVRDVFAPMDVGTDILEWLVDTDEGWELLRKVGKGYLAYLELESRRFKVIGKKLTCVLVDQDIPPKLPKFGDIIPIHEHNGTGQVVVRRVGDEVFVGGRKLVLRSFTPKSGSDRIETVIRENITEPISSSILDALLKFPHSLIPKKWGEKINDKEHGGEYFIPSIIFSGTIYGEGNEQGVRILGDGGEGWRGYYSPISHYWDYRERIVTFEPLESEK